MVTDMSFLVDSGRVKAQVVVAAPAIRSPATVANMVCGFDVLGFAVNDPYDEMHIRFTDQSGIIIINEDEYNLPTEPELNVAGAALLAMLEEVNEPVGFELRICKHIKPGSGVGSRCIRGCE